MLLEHLRANEDKITHRLLSYAQQHGYTKLASPQIKAWQASISDLTNSFETALNHHGDIPRLKFNEDLRTDPIGSFALESAKHHSARGVTTHQFLGLFKYYRQSYVDEIDSLKNESREQYKDLFHRFCDRVEVILGEAWFQQEQTTSPLANEQNQQLTLMEELAEAVFRVDENLIIRYTNQAGAAMLRLDAAQNSLHHNQAINEQDFTGKPFPWLTNELQDMFLENKPSMQTMLPMDHQQGNHYKIRVSPLQDASGKCTELAIIAEDISQLLKSKEALLRSENRMRDFLEGSHDGIAIHEMIYDDKGMPKDYKIIETNQTFIDNIGIHNHKARLKTGSELLNTDPPPYLQTYAKVFQENKPQKFEIYYEPHDRHYLIKAFSIAPDQFVTIFSDITQRVHDENQLKQAIEVHRSIMRATPSAIGMVHSLGERSFGWVNSRMCAMVGYTKEEMVGKSAIMLYPNQEEFDRTNQTFLEQLNQGDVGSTETIWVTKDGDHLHILLKYAPINPKDYHQGIVFTGHDITENKTLQEEQQRFEQQLLRTQKLESLGVLAGGIAHDFNNILVAILGNAELAYSELPNHSTARPYLKDVEQASRRAGELCRQLLAYSGKGRFVIEKINLQDVIEDMTNMLEVSITKKAVLKFRFADSVPPIEADATQMRQIIMNLVINASESIERRSGVISISTGAMDCNKNYLDTTFINEDLTPGTYSYVEVSDTGTGMDQETCDKLFEPFFTTKFTGRGLGMSAALGIIRGHKGAIKVYSELNKGTTIKILLPSAMDGLDEAVDRMESPAKPWKGQGTILLVDDEETVLAVAKKILEKFGFEVMTAENGEIAVELYSKHHKDITAVLMDLTMPKLDGEAAYTQMKLINPDARVILSSGYNEQELSERFGGKATAGFIQKPYRMKELMELLRAIT